jgi:hypothetical protein
LQNQNDGTNPSALNLLSGSDATGFALTNAIDGNRTTENAGGNNTTGGNGLGIAATGEVSAALIDLSAT